MEAVVKKQMALRQKKHEDHNNAMKLNKEQRVEKGQKKLKDDEGKGLTASVYRLNRLQERSQKYKVGTAGRGSC